MQQVEAHLIPAGIGGQIGAAGLGIEAGAHIVPARLTAVSTGNDVEGRQIELGAHQRVAQGVVHPLVDGIAGRLAGAGHHLLRCGGGVRQGCEERLQQGNVVLGGGGDAVGGDQELLDRVGHHRVAKPVDGIGELRRDARINGDVVARKGVDVGGELAGELGKNQMLILRFGDQLGLLEHLLTGPGGGDAQAIGAGVSTSRRVVDETEVGNQLGDVAVVLLVEDVVDRGEADVLVGATITGDEVIRQGLEGAEAVEREEARHGGVIPQGVVTGSGQGRQTGGGPRGAGFGGQGERRLVIQEGMARGEQAQTGGGKGRAVGVLHAHLGSRGIDGHEGCPPRHQGRSVVGVQPDPGDVIDVVVVQREAKLEGIGLDIGPGREFTEGSELGGGGDVGIGIGGRRCARLAHQVAGGNGSAVRQHDVLAQIHRVVGNGAVVLAQVNVGRNRVVALAAAAGNGVSTGPRHVVGTAWSVELVARQQRNVDSAFGSFLDEVEAVVEELTEEAEEAAVGQRVHQAGEGIEAATGGEGRIIEHLQGRETRLAVDQVADDARPGVIDVGATHRVVDDVGRVDHRLAAAHGAHNGEDQAEATSDAGGAGGAGPVDGALIAPAPQDHARRVRLGPQGQVDGTRGGLLGRSLSKGGPEGESVVGVAGEELIGSSPGGVVDVVADALDIADAGRIDRQQRHVAGQPQVGEQEDDVLLREVQAEEKRHDAADRWAGNGRGMTLPKERPA